MDLFIKKLPIVNAVVCMLVLTVLGLHSIIAVSIAVGLAVLSAFLRFVQNCHHRKK